MRSRSRAGAPPLLAARHAGLGALRRGASCGRAVGEGHERWAAHGKAEPTEDATEHREFPVARDAANRSGEQYSQHQSQHRRAPPDPFLDHELVEVLALEDSSAMGAAKPPSIMATISNGLRLLAGIEGT